MEYPHQLSQSDLEVAQTAFPVGIDVRAFSREFRPDSEFHYQNGGPRDHAQQPLDPLLVAYPTLRKTETVFCKREIPLLPFLLCNKYRNTRSSRRETPPRCRNVSSSRGRCP